MFFFLLVLVYYFILFYKEVICLTRWCIHILNTFRFLAGIYLFRVNNRNTRTMCETCSKLTIKTSERHHWRRSGVFIVNSEQISHYSGVFTVDFEQVNTSWVEYWVCPFPFQGFSYNRNFQVFYRGEVCFTESEVPKKGGDEMQRGGSNPSEH